VLAQNFGFQTAINTLPASLLAAAVLVWLAREPARAHREAHDQTAPDEVNAER
jgi:hypothetical protein